MGYALYLESSDGFSAEDWRNAVSAVNDVKLDDSPVVVTNPATGASIRVPGRPNDVAVLVGAEWKKVFSFTGQPASFNATGSVEDPAHPVRRAAAALARQLDAAIVGAEGELYEW